MDSLFGLLEYVLLVLGFAGLGVLATRGFSRNADTVANRAEPLEGHGTIGTGGYDEAAFESADDAWRHGTTACRCRGYAHRAPDARFRSGGRPLGVRRPGCSRT